MSEWLEQTEHELLVRILLEKYYGTKDPDREKSIVSLMEAIDAIAFKLGYEGGN
jgi:hypothetical protein